MHFLSHVQKTYVTMYLLLFTKHLHDAQKNGVFSRVKCRVSARRRNLEDHGDLVRVCGYRRANAIRDGLIHDDKPRITAF